MQRPWGTPFGYRLDSVSQLLSVSVLSSVSVSVSVSLSDPVADPTSDPVDDSDSVSNWLLCERMDGDPLLLRSAEKGDNDRVCDIATRGVRIVNAYGSC
jgi:hypothetical protein